MMRLVIAALAGALFGTGLLVSGMTDPAKVQGWLDVFGTWDPTLGFVLTGAILPMLVAWRVAARRRTALTGTELPPPPPQKIDGRLIAGAALFGLGWGLSGLCPGPAMASLGFGGVPFLIFFAAMVAGMLLFSAWNRRA
ncbi:hypothetical protein J7376_12945 [Paracoccus sp. R12_1]|uniref:DUF6691 family protein n=1 Tax=unclassified Paracoccus (in: a-proteobacteria) TaxID=2688777 RepID=UPI001ADCF368|nr:MULTISPECIES: DUF6691 family protein [unclassified Paracoccus (in: a-proteobacteria)]MBO9456275.1 hypothetical protein [Paracoccus sp. R12_2]MBO9487433.1 hypothetical protein [Paracoccus sp. R12_1]